MHDFLFQSLGAITAASSGWRFELAETQGGTLFSPAIPVQGGRYYRLRFAACVPQRSFEAVNFLDASGQWVADNYDVLYPGDRRGYDRVFLAPPSASSAEVLFRGDCPLTVWDVEVTPATWEEAADFCDRIYAQLPPLDFRPAGNPLALAPRTLAALKEGTPWRVLMLGDSIMQDTYHSQFHALLKRIFPNGQVEWDVSVRSSTGCWHYARPEQFEAYVARHRPQCVFIGGISHWNQPQESPTGNLAIEAVGQMAAEKLDAEVVVMTPTLAQDLRFPKGTPAGTPIRPMDYSLDRDECCGNGYDSIVSSELYEICRRRGWPCWDMTTPAYRWLFASGLPCQFYSRDALHSGELGKQLIARLAAAYFAAAK